MEYQDRIDNLETVNGRFLGTTRDEIFGFWKVVYTDEKNGGIPEELEGRYTSEPRAMEAIKTFLSGSWSNAMKLVRKRELKEHKESVTSG